MDRATKNRNSWPINNTNGTIVPQEQLFQQTEQPSLYTIENAKSSKDDAADFDKAITLCGYGRFHYGLVLLCGLIFMATGFQNGLNAYVLPSAACDLDLSSEEKGLLNVAFLTGATVSAMLWGIIADAYGRKNILVCTLIADGAVTVLSSLSQSFPILFTFRFFNGFVIGAPGCLVFSYLGEFHAEKQRAKSICYVGFFFTVAWLILPGVAWIIIPLRIDVRINGFLFNSWRLFVAIFSLPALLAGGILFFCFPETPKYLVSQGKYEDALKVFRNIYAANTGKAAKDYPVKILLADGFAEADKSGRNRDDGKTSMAKILSSIWRQIRCLFAPPLLKYAILCSGMLFANMFGYYGLGLWLPELFNRFEKYYKLHPDTTVSVCELTSIPLETGGSVAQAITEMRNSTGDGMIFGMKPDVNVVDAKSHGAVVKCTGSNMDRKVFINALIINGVSLLGNIGSGYLADRLGRRTMPIATMVFAGVSGCAIYFPRSTTQNLIVACLFSTFIATSNMVLYSVIVDIFPTQVSGMAVCLATLVGRMGAIISNILFGSLLDISCGVPIFFVGGVVMFGGLIGIFIPKKGVLAL